LAPQTAANGGTGGWTVQGNDAHVFRLRDGKVAEFWNASTDPYAYDEVFG
jgi:ketosteroid isomerase-like protein